MTDWLCIFDFIVRQLVVRHYKVYYPVRHSLLQHMVNSLQKLGFSLNVSKTFSHRLLSFISVKICFRSENNFFFRSSHAYLKGICPCSKILKVINSCIFSSLNNLAELCPAGVSIDTIHFISTGQFGAPQTVSWPGGHHHQVGADENQGGTGEFYRTTGWVWKGIIS